MTYGAKKYADNNWRQATSWNRYYDAAMRHMVAWQQGEDVDESGFHPIDHAVCSLMMLSSLIKTGVGEDDRYRLATEEIGPGRNDNLPHVFSKESTVRTNKKG